MSMEPEGMERLARPVRGHLMSSDSGLLDRQIEALFTHDQAGRLLRVNEPNGGLAPRFFLGRTREGNRWRLRADVPADAASELVRLAEGEPVVDDLRAPPVNLDAMLEVLGHYAPSHVYHHGPAYRFPISRLVMPRGIRLAANDRAQLRDLPGWEADFDHEPERGEPRFVVIADGVAVAICASVRLTDWVAEAGVEVLPAFRGRGYAGEVVAAWADAIRATGRVPLYSTSWDNLASQAVARKLELSMYAVDLSLA